MAKKKKTDLYLEDYIDDDESIFDLEKNNDFSHNPNYEYDDTYDISDDDYEVGFDDGNSNSLEVESDDYINEDEIKNKEDEETLDEDLGGDMIFIFTLISTWFGRVGIIIAILLILYFLFTAKFTTMFLYVVGLIGAFFFGYLFMYLLERFTNSN